MNRELPQCVYLKHGAYWLVKANKWTRLGAKLGDALKAYAGIVGNDEAEGTMPALIDDAMTVILARVGASTRGNYQTAARKLKYAFAEFNPGQVTSFDVWKLRDEMADTPNMTNRCLSLLRQIFDFAVQRGVVESNVAVEVKPHKEPPRERLLSVPEYEAIYAKAGARLQIIMDLLVLTGQRVRDVLNIRRADLSDEGIAFKQQKTGKKLIVRWSPALHTVVARAKALQGDVPALTLLYGRYRGALDYRSVFEQWQVACKAAHVTDAQMRDLRAMSLTMAEDEGKNATALAAHSSPAMTKRYLRGKKIARVDGPSFRRV